LIELNDLDDKNYVSTRYIDEINRLSNLQAYDIHLINDLKIFFNENYN
jgi:hypothetical protein